MDTFLSNPPVQGDVAPFVAVSSSRYALAAAAVSWVLAWKLGIE